MYTVFNAMKPMKLTLAPIVSFNKVNQPNLIQGLNAMTYLRNMKNETMHWIEISFALYMMRQFWKQRNETFIGISLKH
jgi:hypothetical protein